jgi:uncharacterized protein YbaR (Trm112 family)
MATPNTTTEIERLIGRVETLEELVEYARTQDELERLRRSLAVAKSLVEHAKAINERWRECSMAHDDDDAPFVLVCPKCQSPNVGVADNVPRVWRSYEQDGATLAFHGHSQEMYWDGCSDTSMCCNSCGEVWDIPDEVEIDFT